MNLQKQVDLNLEGFNDFQQAIDEKDAIIASHKENISKLNAEKSDLSKNIDGKLKMLNLTTLTELEWKNQL